jgi:hypothetical protein
VKRLRAVNTVPIKSLPPRAWSAGRAMRDCSATTPVVVFGTAIKPRTLGLTGGSVDLIIVDNNYGMSPITNPVAAPFTFMSA